MKMIKDYEKYMLYMKDFNNELMELNIKYSETLENQKIEIEKRERIIKGLIDFIGDSMKEEVIERTYNMNFEEFKKWIMESILNGSDKE